jgi:putative methyltransferase (TIGR04325 family)
MKGFGFSMTPKAFIKLFAPPVLVQGYRILRGRQENSVYGLSGDYGSWDEAVRASTGYDSQIILEKTKTALLQVKNGQVAYERDSVVFAEIQYSWPLLAGLLWVAAQSCGRLNVLDFGGSLGSTYFQNRVFLRRLTEVRWNVIEQPRHIETGRAWFEDEALKFYLCVEDCVAETQPNVVILSSVLQYLERPYDILCGLLGLPCDHVIIDRTPFWDGPTDRLCVQHVPPSIYPASYPSWILSTRRLRSHLHDGWEVVAEFDSLDKLAGPVDVAYRGMILTKRNFCSDSLKERNNQ